MTSMVYSVTRAAPTPSLRDGLGLSFHRADALSRCYARAHNEQPPPYSSAILSTSLRDDGGLPGSNIKEGDERRLVPSYHSSSWVVRGVQVATGASICSAVASGGVMMISAFPTVTDAATKTCTAAVATVSPPVLVAGVFFGVSWIPVDLVALGVGAATAAGAIMEFGNVLMASGTIAATSGSIMIASSACALLGGAIIQSSSDKSTAFTNGVFAARVCFWVASLCGGMVAVPTAAGIGVVFSHAWAWISPVCAPIVNLLVAYA